MDFWHDTWQWWLHYGLDGIAGGVIGGAVTGLAVWWTLRHERRASREAELRSSVVQLHATSTRASIAVPGAQGRLASGDLFDRIFSESIHVLVLSGNDQDQALHRTVQGAITDLSALLGDKRTDRAVDDDFRETTGVLVARLSLWLQDAKKYRRQADTDAHKVHFRSEIKAGKTQG